MNNLNQVNIQTQSSPTEVLLPIIIIALIIVGLAVGGYFWYRYLKYARIKNIRDLVMLKVSLPKEVIKPEEKERTKEDFKELLSVAEQFFSSLSGAYKSGFKGSFGRQPRFSFEIIAKAKEIFFYVGAPRELRNYVERQIHSFYPNAQIEESKDFKIFSPDAKAALGSLKISKKFVYPIKTYKQLESDPINAVTNALAKLPEGENAAIQILLRPNSGRWMSQCSWAARDIQRGKPIHTGWGSRILYGFGDLLGGIFKSQSKDQMSSHEEQIKLTPMHEEVLKAMREKGSKVGFDTQIRVIVVSNTQQEANASLDNILNIFSQYNAPEFNNLKKLGVASNKRFLTRYILREFSSYTSILNTEELASIFHFPNKFTETPNIHWIKARNLPPPADLPSSGTLIGESHFRGEVKPVYIADDDRRRHMFMIGKTGVGKTTLYLTMIKQDIEKGHGCAFLDPNGDAAEQILRYIPKERAEDVIYFDPSDTERPMGLNLLDWQRPEDKDYLIAEWLEIFYKLFDPNKTGMVGPQFEHWGRNAALTVMAQPGGGSLLEIPRLFTDDEFKDRCISYVKDPVVLAFWQQQMAKTADFHKSEMFNYFISKFGRFMTNDVMRNIIGQPKSAFDFREVMDNGKILVVNLSKGKLGEMNSYLLGMIIVSKLQVGAFQRADTPEEKRKDFYLFVDEFQNFTTNSFKTILSEARKYRLNLAVANQYIQQLSEEIRDACIGNAGTLLCYRAGAADAEFMAKEFPGVGEQDITNLPFASLYVKLLIGGTPAKPFSMKGIKTDPTQSEKVAEAIRQLSRLKYGKDKREVEEDIKKRTLSQTDAVPAPGPPRES